MRMKVVFPAPLGPRTAVTWPRSAVKSRPARAWVALKRLVSPRASTMGGTCGSLRWCVVVGVDVGPLAAGGVPAAQGPRI
jgi:hypothetical protein